MKPFLISSFPLVERLVILVQLTFKFLNYLTEYEKAGGKLKGTGLILAKVDSTTFPGLAKEFDIEGFPTLILFRKGERVETYTGERKAEGIVTVS